MALLTRLRFDNSYARLHPGFYEVVDPTPLPEPYLVAFNPEAAALLDLDPAEGHNPELPLYLSGGKRLPGAEPIAQVYGGHQFGVWVPQLGDGRAFLVGEVRNQRGEKWDLHLKGAGRTRFSRGGDGRSALRSVVREYLASEALAGLGIPTTRALCVVGSDLPVQRERIETAATLLRLSPSHVRFGTFEFFAAKGETERVGELASYVIREHLASEVDAGWDDADRRLRLFGEGCRRTARLIARWMAAGFAHGVMNTDNMSVLGLTLDYGPYGFLDDYDAGFICNHTDVAGHYAFDQQPAIGEWNCARLGDALREGTGAELEGWQAELATYWPAFADEYTGLMRAKLGLATAREEDAELIEDLLQMLQTERADYTRFFRGLGGYRTTGESASGSPRGSVERRVWLARYRARLQAEGSVDAERAERMARVNPKYVLRNWIAQEAIEQAEQKQFELIEELRRMFADPFADHPEMERFAARPAAAAREIAVSCSS
jgi:uncharacterized protein YdiU (UPF0061 family)